jgi:hypothetical protein
MYKIYASLQHCHAVYIRKYVLIMKLIMLILMVTVMQVSATTYAQQITYRKSNASLQEVMNAIQTQTGYDFIFNAELLRDARRVNINLNKSSLTDALKLSFENQPFTYVINNKTIVLSRKAITKEQKTAQNIVVTGKVTDEKNQPVPGASVRIKNVAIGTSTDSNGNFRITVPSQESILIFSSIGSSAVETKVGERRQINIILKENTQQLDEMVVVAYGTVSKKDLTKLR